jgi:hypothetical protein
MPYALRLSLTLSLRICCRRKQAFPIMLGGVLYDRNAARVLVIKYTAVFDLNIPVE